MTSCTKTLCLLLFLNFQVLFFMKKPLTQVVMLCLKIHNMCHICPAVAVCLPDPAWIFILLTSCQRSMEITALSVPFKKH